MTVTPMKTHRRSSNKWHCMQWWPSHCIWYPYQTSCGPQDMQYICWMHWSFHCMNQLHTPYPSSNPQSRIYHPPQPYMMSHLCWHSNRLWIAMLLPMLCYPMWWHCWQYAALYHWHNSQEFEKLYNCCRMTNLFQTLWSMQHRRPH